jgi:hypothetical protein
MQLSASLSGFGDATPGATTQPRANSGLICWLVALPYLMGALRGTANPLSIITRDGIWHKRGGGEIVGVQHHAPKGRPFEPRSESILEVGQRSRPIPRFAGRQDTLNLVSGTLTASVPNVQVCQAMSLRRNFLLSLQPCLKYAQNTTL